MGSVLVFGACAFAAWSSAVGITWLAQYGLRTGPANSRDPQLISAAQTGNPEILSAQLRGKLVTGQECAAAVDGLSPSDTWKLLRGFDTTFWRTNPNAAIFVRQASLSLGKHGSPDSLLSDLSSLFRERQLEEARSRRLVVAAFIGMLEARELTEQELVATLRKAPAADALSLMEAWLDFQKPGSPQADLDTALRIAAQFSPQLDDRMKDDITAMIVRVWSHRAPPIADALLFATKFEGSRVHERLLFEGSRMLAVANPEELQRRMIQFAPVMAKEAGAMAATAGFSIAQAFAMAKQMQGDDADEFLRTYVEGYGAGDPREMSKIADTYLAKDLPESAAESVAKGLMKGSDRGRMDAWMEGLSIEAQAKLWDSAADPIHGMDASTARYYLEKHPREVPLNAWMMRRVLNALPYEEAVQALPLGGELKGRLRIEMFGEISRNRIRQLLNESPERIPELLATVPIEVRSSVMNQALGEWVDPDPQMMQRWIEQVEDPKLQSDLAIRLLKNEIEHGNLVEVQDRMLQWMNSGAPPESYVAMVEKILAAEGDSGRASAFIHQLPLGKVRDQATLTLAKKWAAVDPVATSEWLADLPAGRGRDLGTRALISAARDDPERALTNAAGIEDPELRFTAARSVLRVWRDEDPVRAEAFVRAAGFSPDETAALQAILGIRSVEGTK